MYKKQLEVIKAMSELTRIGKLAWSQTDFDCYEAAIANYKFKIEFIYLARTDDTGSDRTIARLSAFQLMLDYSIAEGMDLLCKMLAFSNQEWSALRNLGQQRLSNGLEVLQRLAVAD